MYTLNGQPCDVEELIAANEFDPEEIAAIRAMQPGDTVPLGGGAVQDFILERLTEPAEATVYIVVQEGDHRDYFLRKLPDGKSNPWGAEERDAIRFTCRGEAEAVVAEFQCSYMIVCRTYKRGE